MSPEPLLKSDVVPIPEPLRTNPRLLAVDLEGTLIEPFIEKDEIIARPGATRLLQELNCRGYTIILMSTAVVPDDDLFQAQPEWKSFIKKTIWGSEIRSSQGAYLSQYAHALFRPSTQLEILRGILDGYRGGKYPPLFGIGGGIIDDVCANQSSLSELGEYGFHVFDPRNKMGEDEKSDAWVDRVLQQIDIKDGKKLFPMTTLHKLAREVRNCNGNHENLQLMDKVRKITMNGEYRRLFQEADKTDYLIPTASWETIPGVQGLVPRDFIQDVILYAALMVYSRLVPHGLSKQELETIYKHHCVEQIVREGNIFKMTEEDSLLTLSHYINRVVAQQHDLRPVEI